MWSKATLFASLLAVAGGGCWRGHTGRPPRPPQVTQVTSGLNETASGNGTTTNTGTNTENQGTGGTDDPRR